VSLTQAERDLEAAGIDVKAERGQASAWLSDLEGERAVPSLGNEVPSEGTERPSEGNKSPMAESFSLMG
jgi:hypothetical protein